MAWIRFMTVAVLVDGTCLLSYRVESDMRLVELITHLPTEHFDLFHLAEAAQQRYEVPLYRNGVQAAAASGINNKIKKVVSSLEGTRGRVRRAEWHAHARVLEGNYRNFSSRKTSPGDLRISNPVVVARF